MKPRLVSRALSKATSLVGSAGMDSSSSVSGSPGRLNPARE
jgi:hypothetical protein